MQTILDFARKELHLELAPIQIPGSHIWVCSVNVRPKLAADWLERFNPTNRSKRQGPIDKYVSDMIAKLWRETHQGIAFDSDGKLISGQHRLEAVVKSNTSQKFVIFLNCAATERAVIDQGAPRTVRDVARLAFGTEITADIVAIARALYMGIDISHNAVLTPQQTYQLVEDHKKPIDFVLAQVPRRVVGVTAASVMGAVVRGFYHTTQTKIKGFMGILVEGYSLKSSDDDRGVIALRNWLLEHQMATRTRQGRVKSYRFTEAVLQAYIKGTPLPKLVQAEEEVFPLPEEK